MEYNHDCPCQFDRGRGDDMKFTVKAGTEEIGFYSETGTYNRDDIPCIDFAVPKEPAEKAERLIEKIKEMQKALLD